MPRKENEPLTSEPTLDSMSHFSQMAVPLIVVDPSVNVIVYVDLTLRALVFMADVLNTSHEQLIDQLARPARNVFHVPVVGDAVSMVSHPLDSLHDFCAAIFVPFRDM